MKVYLLIFLVVILKLCAQAQRYEEGDECDTKGGAGTCVTAGTCLTVTSNRERQQRHCGFSGSGALVCCPPPAQAAKPAQNIEFQTRVDTKSCDDGSSCVLLRDCPSVLNLADRRKTMKFVAENSCGNPPPGRALICCPDSKPTTTTTVPTPSEQPDPCYIHDVDDFGVCVKLGSCPRLSMMMQRKLFAKERQFLRSRQCGFTNGVPYVCCSDDDFVTTQTELITTTTTTKKPKPTTKSTTTTRPTRILYPNLTTKPTTIATTTTKSTTTTSTTTSTTTHHPRVEWLEKLKNLLPQPPQCGQMVSDRIFGGEITKIDDHPWMVLLQYETRLEGKVFRCGGSLISDRYVLTAAHCVKKISKDWKLISVRLGEWDLSKVNDCDSINSQYCTEPVIDISISKAIVHENYRAMSKEQLYDIALLRLSEPVEQFTRFVHPICMPLDPELRDISYEGQSFMAAGWGHTENRTGSNVKMQILDLPFVHTDDCNAKYKKGFVKDDQICAGGKAGKDTCKGDSGGPLMLEEFVDGIPQIYVHGIVSYGKLGDCGKEGVPAVYTKVSGYLEWISKHIRE